MSKTEPLILSLKPLPASVLPQEIHCHHPFTMGRTQGVILILCPQPQHPVYWNVLPIQPGYRTVSLSASILLSPKPGHTYPLRGPQQQPGNESLLLLFLIFIFLATTLDTSQAIHHLYLSGFPKKAGPPCGCPERIPEQKSDQKLLKFE